MKRALLVMLLAVAAIELSGCHTCRRIGGWFNRGDACDPPPSACPPGVPRATVMYPSSPQVLPGPIEIAPVN